MFAHIFNRCWLAVIVFIVTAVPLLAEETDAVPETQEWVLPYAVMILFLGLILLILLRPTKRQDSAFSFDEIQAQREEEMKKIKGGH
jgi:NADH:ubiquinone oxidoreductase subunit 6 (subunit J)